MKALVIGPRGIGSVYVDYLIKLQYDVNVYSRSVGELDALMSNQYQIGVICSPAETHLTYIKLLQQCCDKVIVEKPLISHSDYRLIGDVDKRKVTTNLAMIGLSSQLKMIHPQRPSSLTFEYHTTGRHRGLTISEDLLPHALSFAMSLLNENEIELQDYSIENNANAFYFCVGGVSYTVKFTQGVVEKSVVNIKMDDSSFTREHEVLDEVLLTYLVDDHGNRHLIDDPLTFNLNKIINADYNDISYQVANQSYNIIESIA